MRVETSEIPGLLIVKQKSAPTAEGWFFENWHRGKMVALGVPDFVPVQHNVTRVYSRGATRGIHAEPWDRLISLVQGRAMGAWVDLRAGAGFGKVVVRELTPTTAVFVPRGVANSHQVLEDDTIFSYLMDQQWTEDAPKRYASVNLFDPALGIDWPIPAHEATVVRRDELTPLLKYATPLQERQTLLVGTDTPLGQALAAEMPGATGTSYEALISAQSSDTGLDISAFDTLIVAEGTLIRANASAPPRPARPWNAATDRHAALADIARRHGLRYVYISQACRFEHDSSEHDEAAELDLSDPRSREAAVGEVIASGVPRHLIIRTQWATGREAGFVHDVASAVRAGRRVEVSGGQYGRLTFVDRLGAGIRHLLDGGSANGRYNITGDGPVVGLIDVARRVVELSGHNAGAVAETADSQPGIGGPLSLRKVKDAGFRPGNAWLELETRLTPRRAAAEGHSPTAPASADRPYRVLFVCTANICRSAYANVMAAAAQIPGVEFISAGTHGLVGEPLDPPLASIAERHGVAPAHEAQQLTKELAESADLILAMGNEHRRYILDVWPSLARKTFIIGQAIRHIADAPAGTGFNQITDHLWSNRSTAPGDEVPDPYRRGQEAAEACAIQLDGYISVLADRLTEISNASTEGAH
ncbi:MAG: dTDP-4-dehydrorhamnose 3,5-epimerase family protein [Propionibacteriaceae bacterium]|nr:dTDP-4-dehydrorhamnose 3,5-epimerase family protein [Propionibacteriaceae bacterium]